jgi:DNA-binding MarR family transcriptional regulator
LVSPTTAQYERLLELRTGLRQFLHWSEEQARAQGLTPAQHQLLLAVKGHPGPEDPTVSNVVHSLVLRPHSVVGLIDRAQRAGLLRRHRDAKRHTLVRLRLTPAGEEKLEALTAAHLAELTRLAPAMEAMWGAAGEASEQPPGPA